MLGIYLFPFSLVPRPRGRRKIVPLLRCLGKRLNLIDTMFGCVDSRHEPSSSSSPRFVPYHGLIALACGYVVAVKQFHPDSVAFPPPAPPTLRVKVVTEERGREEGGREEGGRREGGRGEGRRREHRWLLVMF